MTDKKPPLTLVPDPAENAEALSAAIIKISDCMDRLSRSGLNRRALVVLIKDASGVNQRDIKLVLDSLERLKALYTKAKP